jgi:hypothetical protein
MLSMNGPALDHEKPLSGQAEQVGWRIHGSIIGFGIEEGQLRLQ